MKVLVIWDSCGLESIKLYEAVGELALLAVAADDQYINSSDLDEDAAIYKLQDVAMCNTEGDEIEHPDCRLIDGKEVCGPYDRIVSMGFLP